MRLITLIAATTILSGSVFAADWRRTESPHGFEVELPLGWGTRVSGGSMIIISPAPENPLAEHAYVRYLQVRGDRDAATVAADLVEKYRHILPKLRVNGFNKLKSRMRDCCTMTGSFRRGYPEEHWRFFALVSVRDGTARVTGFAAPTARYERLRPSFVRCLATFKMNKTLRDVRRIAPKMTEWLDPRENAFTVPAPSGWKMEGGVVRLGRLTANQFDMTHPEDASTFVMARGPMAPVYHEPSQMHRMLGLREGQMCGENAMLQRYRGVEHYVKQMFLPFIERQYGRIRLMDFRAKPSEEKIYREVGMRMLTERAEATIKMRYEGKIIRSRIWVTIYRSVAQNTGIWMATVWAAGGPGERYEQAVDVAMQAMCGFRPNQRWQKMESQHQRKMHAIVMKGMSDRAAIRARYSRDISDMRMKLWRENNARMDEIHRKQSNVIRGTVDLHNPETGETIWGVEANSTHYYQSASHYYGTGGIVGTDVTSSRLEANGVELQNLDDLRR